MGISQMLISLFWMRCSRNAKGPSKFSKLKVSVVVFSFEEVQEHVAAQLVDAAGFFTVSEGLGELADSGHDIGDPFRCEVGGMESGGVIGVSVDDHFAVFDTRLIGKVFTLGVGLHHGTCQLGS